MQTRNPDKEHRQESEVYGGDETLASLKARSSQISIQKKL
ncbi:hypothetical protein NC652_033632 [Populus alba x Populus x berolinensis]|uniref:Uncharacterized protein n=1 Tax=Populus alba x Populus x berolinensis TaxID=444605 RepID=A0AAD6Q0G8_9ROSI|nr:hypothetical protein NC652_033632 [Populus alba x Populus x berolinensis]KAJ6973265.1 hypothetical protein NC653_033560 [Populus alba x Populus x berolinensis]